jgi:hypothetical protein
MQTLVLDAATRDKLAALRQRTELRDEAGRLLGHYVPAEPACPWEPGLNEQEIARRIREPGASSLDEFWRRQGAS